MLINIHICICREREIKHDNMVTASCSWSLSWKCRRRLSPIKPSAEWVHWNYIKKKKNQIDIDDDNSLLLEKESQIDGNNWNLNREKVSLGLERRGKRNIRITKINLSENLCEGVCAYRGRLTRYFFLYIFFYTIFFFFFFTERREFTEQQRKKKIRERERKNETWKKFY